MNTRQQRHRSGNEKWAKLQSNFTHTLFETREKQRQTYALAHNSHTHDPNRTILKLHSLVSIKNCLFCLWFFVVVPSRHLSDSLSVLFEFCNIVYLCRSLASINSGRFSLCVCADVVFTVIYMFHSNS